MVIRYPNKKGGVSKLRDATLFIRVPDSGNFSTCNSHGLPVTYDRSPFYFLLVLLYNLSI